VWLVVEVGECVVDGVEYDVGGVERANPQPPASRARSAYAGDTTATRTPSPFGRRDAPIACAASRGEGQRCNSE
jgi:hypothetical protein